MRCPSPITVKVTDKVTRLPRWQEVPCGKCVICQHNRLADWTFRILAEKESAVNAYFVTLTYNDEHLPYFVNKRDIQLFFKRLRKACSSDGLKYFITSEYGETNNRPHYHAIIFNVFPKNIKYYLRMNDLFEKVWKNGYTYTVSDVNESSIRYVVKYILKENIDEEKKSSLFYTMSKNLGISYLDYGRKNNLRNRLSSNVNFAGRKWHLPRYYQEKVFSRGQRQAIAEDTRGSIHDAYVSRCHDEAEYQEYLHQTRLNSCAYCERISRRRKGI